ncbi:MAG: DMT family transporter [Pseudomonadota bacterium]|nr:DMT family transporter [Pseudomonadota bacterium]
MHPLAVAAVLLAALTHATWNLAAKRAARARHFVWLYSAGSVVLYLPVVAWILVTHRPQFSPLHWLALALTGVLHIGYSLLLQAGYRASDLSLVYPLARGTGPLVAFLAATFILGEPASAWSALGVVLVVAGILMVSGLAGAAHKAPRAGIVLGMLTGVFVAAYTINDGWAVTTLMISPFIVDFTGNLLRLAVLSPLALRDRPGLRAEAKTFRVPVLTVALLGPMGYILVLFAMRLAPIGHVAPMREMGTLIGMYFGARLLKEGVSPLRMAGAVLMVGGVVTLAVTG